MTKEQRETAAVEQAIGRMDPSDLLLPWVLVWGAGYRGRLRRGMSQEQAEVEAFDDTLRLAHHLDALDDEGRFVANERERHDAGAGSPGILRRLLKTARQVFGGDHDRSSNAETSTSARLAASGLSVACHVDDKSTFLKG